LLSAGLEGAGRAGSFLSLEPRVCARVLLYSSCCAVSSLPCIVVVVLLLPRKLRREKDEIALRTLDEEERGVRGCERGLAALQLSWTDAKLELVRTVALIRSARRLDLLLLTACSHLAAPAASPRLARSHVQLSGSLSQPSNPPLCRPRRSRRIQEGKACGPPRSWSQSRPPAVRFSGLVRRRAVFRLRLSMSSQLEQAGARLSILAPARSLSSSRLRASSAHSHASRAAPSRAAAPTRSRTRTHRARPRP